MGSVGIYVHTDDITRDVVEKYLGENTRPGNEVLYSSWQATGTGRWGDRWSYVLYQAVREVSTGEVIAWVTLAGRGDHQVYIKCLTEQCGPGQSSGVPNRLLVLLTETSSEYAQQWRAAAHRWPTTRREALRAKGSQIRFAEPLQYSFGEATDFRVESLTRLRSLNGRLCRAPREWWLGRWDSVAVGAAPTH